MIDPQKDYMQLLEFIRLNMTMWYRTTKHEIAGKEKKISKSMED